MQDAILQGILCHVVTKRHILQVNEPHTMTWDKTGSAHLKNKTRSNMSEEWQELMQGGGKPENEGVKFVKWIPLPVAQLSTQSCRAEQSTTVCSLRCCQHSPFAPCVILPYLPHLWKLKSGVRHSSKNPNANANAHKTESYTKECKCSWNYIPLLLSKRWNSSWVGWEKQPLITQSLLLVHASKPRKVSSRVSAKCYVQPVITQSLNSLTLSSAIAGAASKPQKLSPPCIFNVFT